MWWRGWDLNPRTPKGRDHSSRALVDVAGVNDVPYAHLILSPARLTGLRYPSTQMVIALPRRPYFMLAP